MLLSHVFCFIALKELVHVEATVLDLGRVYTIHRQKSLFHAVQF